jgi:ACS family hexuronate transporter-like MFS transporter
MGESVGGYRWVVLGAATAMQVGISMPQQTPAAIGPILVPALHLSSAELGLLTSTIWGGMLLGMIPFGFLVDRLGERRIVLVGAVGLTTFLLLGSLQSAFLPLLLLFIPAAFGAASGSPGGTRAIAEWFPPSRRGLALGIRQSGVTAAGVLAALVLPPIAVGLGWEAAFRTVAVVSLASVVLFVVLYREPAGGRTRGAVEFRPGEFLRDRRFLAGTGFAWMFMGVLGAEVTYLPATMHTRAGLSPIEAGALLAVLQVGGVVGRIGWGMLSDVIRSRTIAMALAGALTAVACALLAFFARPGVPTPALAGLAALLGLSGMGWNAVYVTLTSETVPVQRAATAVGVSTTITFTGMFVGTPLFGALVDRSGGYELPWLALAGWALVGTCLALTAGRSRTVLA